MKKLFMTLSLALICAVAFAVPAKRGQWKTVKLADGTEVRAELRGDEFCHYWQAEDGRKFVINDKTKLAEPADIDAMIERAGKMRANATAARLKRSPMSRVTVGEEHAPYEGEKKGLIILVEFADVAFTEGDSLGFYRRMVNEEGFSEGKFRGSLKDYFKDQSYGKFSIDFDVVGPVKVDKSYKYYGANNFFGYEDMDKVVEMVVDACEAVDSLVDFSDYDWDGDSIVDQVFIIYAGYGEADYDDPNTIWPHQYNISYIIDKPSFDGVYVDTYACGSELNGSGNTCGIGTICHEFSHCLGLPDLYDTTYAYNNYGMGYWSLMDAGNYNGDGYLPAGYTSYERWYAGWIEPIELANDTTVAEMGPLDSTGDAYIIYNDGHPDEYYLLENRQLEGWDAALPGSGMLILHVDFNASVWANNLVNSTRTQRCTIFHADNMSGWSASDLAGDTYPCNGNDSLTNTSKPSAKLHHSNTDGSKFMNKSVTAITQNEDGTMSFEFAKNADEGGETGISVVNAGAHGSADRRIYSLDGRYVGTDWRALKKGVYVINGKKVVK